MKPRDRRADEGIAAAAGGALPHPAAGESQGNGRERSAAWLAAGVFAAMSLYCAVRSEGFVAADACVHYLYARFAFHEPTRFVDVWARPLVTALYALPAAAGGRLAVRIVCLGVAICCAGVAQAIARGQHIRRPVLALIFTLGQPMLFLHSFGEMTELPFALVLGAAFLAYQKRRPMLACFLVSLTPLARPEGFGFIALVALAALARRKWLALALLPIPILIWSWAGFHLTGGPGPWWRWLIDSWPYAGRSMYASGSVFVFVAQLPAIVSPLVLPATLAGIAISLRPREGASVHLRFCRQLTALVPLFVLIAHSLLYGTGRLASFGEVRYLLVAAPFWGVLSAAGWEWLADHFRRPLALRWAAVALLPPFVVNLARPAVPVPLSADWRMARQLAAWYAAPRVRSAHPHLMAGHPGVFYYLDVSPCDLDRVCSWDAAHAASPPPGTLLIWDPIYSSQNASADHAIALADLAAAGWVELRDAPVGPDAMAAGPGAWHVFISPR